MKRSLLLIPILLLGITNIIAQNTKVAKQPLLDYMVFKQYTSLDNEIEDSQLEQDRTDAYLISKTTIAFTYNLLGQLSTITISGGDYKQTLTYYYNLNLQLTAITTNDRTYKAELTYINNLVTEKVEHLQEGSENTEKVTTISYNDKGLVDKLILNYGGDNQPTELTYKYNNEGELSNIKSKYGEVALTYDDKKTPIASLANYFITFPTEFLSFLDSLSHTSHKDRHNIIRIDTDDRYVLNTYTYNKDGLPLTAISKTYEKNIKFDHTDFDTIEYHYK